MKIFIWRGDRISEAYHDDGVLVVLAETEEQARTVALAERDEYHRKLYIWEKRRDAAMAARGGVPLSQFWQTPEGMELWAERESALLAEPWDGDRRAIERAPDEVIELDTPRIVAFNGGGYD